MSFRAHISRSAVLRLAQSTTARSRPTLRPMLALRSVRYNSQKSSPEDWQKILEHKNDMARDWDAKILSYEDVKPRTQQPSSDLYLIDVREPDEVKLGSIPSSVNLPLSTLGGALHLKPEEFKNQYGFEKPKTSQEVIFYCRSGKRSASACDVAKRNGFTNLANYKGSWLDWISKEGIKSS